MPQTIVEKLAQAHRADGPDRPWRAGDFVSIRPRYVMTHDNTSAVMKKFKSIGATRIHDPRQVVYALDHDIQNTSEENLKKYRSIETFAREQGVDFYPAGTGIGHQIMVQEGYVTPGSFVVASDSHSNMYGALGAIGTPIVRTDAAAVWATGEFWWQIPRTVQVILEGQLPPGSTGKDVIIALCGLYNKEEVLNAAVEFTGPGVASLSMDARLTISNMSTEWGALVAWFPCDAVTISYMRAILDRETNPTAPHVSRISERGDFDLFTKQDLAAWQDHRLTPDSGATYAARIRLNLSEVTPHLSGPDTVQTMQSLAAIERRQVAIQKAYLVSCVNSRLEDLEDAALVLEGQKVAGSVKFYLAAASRRIQEEAEARGIWRTLTDAGAIPLPPGCGPCIGLGTGLLEAGEVGISATNRNFKGRMGSRDAQCYLASPAVVAASAVAGYITGPENLLNAEDAKCAKEQQEKERNPVIPSGAPAVGAESRDPYPRHDSVIPSGAPVVGAESRDLGFQSPDPPITRSPDPLRPSASSALKRCFEDLSGQATISPERTTILPGFPAELRGRLVFVPKDNLNTDAIYAGKYTYSDNVPPETMAQVIFDNYDPQLAACTRPGDVLVGGFNFGTGSSREQAATSLKYKGFPLVIAGSFSQTYLRNAYNNGLLCIEVPALVHKLREQFADAIDTGEKTIIADEQVVIDFTRGLLTWRGEQFSFPALGTVPQSLVIAGGVENVVAKKLGLNRVIG